MTIDPKTITIPMAKRAPFVTLSRDFFDFETSERFPRKHHVIVHEITPAQQTEYDDFARRWTDIRAAWDAVVDEGETRGWAQGVHGYEWEDAELLPLEPATEHIYDESEDQWRERVAKILAHHRDTGEWLEQPQPTFHERIMGAFNRSFVPVPKPVSATFKSRKGLDEK